MRDSMDAPPRKSLFSRLPSWKIWVPVLVVITLVGVPLLYRWSQLRGIPDIGDPFDVRTFTEVVVPDEENAFVEYQLAAQFLDSRPMVNTSDYTDEMETRWTAAPRS